MLYERLPALFSSIHGPACVVATLLVIFGGNPLFSRAIGEPDGGRLLILFVPLYATFLLRALQFTLVIMGNYYFKKYYSGMRAAFSVFALLNTILCGIFWMDVKEEKAFQICIVYADVICIMELLLRDTFRRFQQDKLVLECADFFVRSDAQFRDHESGFSMAPSQYKLRLQRIQAQIQNFFKSRSTGDIALPGNETSLALAAASTSVESTNTIPYTVPFALTNVVLRWDESSQIGMPGTLWISAEKSRMSIAIAENVLAALSQSSKGAKLNTTALVDVSSARAVFWPLVDGLVRASADYRNALGTDPPWQFRYYFPYFAHTYPTFASNQMYMAPWPDRDEAGELVYEIVCEPLRHAQLDPDNPPSPVTLIFHGLNSSEHVAELYYTIRVLQAQLEASPAMLRIVVISEPHLLALISDPDRHIMEHLSAVSVDEGGLVVSSEDIPPSPKWAENLFLLMVDAIRWGHSDGKTAVFLWDAAKVISAFGDQEPEIVKDEDMDSPIADSTRDKILDILQHAHEIREMILQILWKFPEIPPSFIQSSRARDIIQIAKYIESVFDINVSTISREQGMRLLNSLHEVLYEELPENNFILMPQLFVRKAQRLLAKVAINFGELPTKLYISNLELLADHPKSHGGFSEIYHAKWIPYEGRAVEVAVKVLRRFSGNRKQKHKEDRGVLELLIREALLWAYLRHENVAVFFGVEMATFGNPALVALWMPRGSLLKYLKGHSPASLYALDMIQGIIAGLNYLHSFDILHGDLCARNILINSQGRPMITDFGMASLIEPDDSPDAESKPGGSTRWMAPELFSPPFKRTFASDLWSFACVCCEIWTEGECPFDQIQPDSAVESHVKKAKNSASDSLQPYDYRPVDHEGVHMLHTLWQLVRWCWSAQASERPITSAVAETVDKILKSERQND